MSFTQTQKAAWAAIFDRFKTNETPNGPGSKLDATLAVRNNLPYIIDVEGIRTIFDAPCGDWNWMQHVCLGDAPITARSASTSIATGDAILT